MSSKRSDDSTHWLINETADDWVATAHDRVYLRDGARRLDSDHPVIEAGRKVAEAFGDWDVVITYGPYRGYDVQYRAFQQSKAINLDFYSIRPGLQYVDNVIQDIEQDIAENTDD